MNPNQLIHRYLLGEATKAEVERLDRLLADDPQLRQRMVMEAQTDAGLREIALERMAGSVGDGKRVAASSLQHASIPMRWIVAIAATMLLAIFAWSQFSGPRIIAELVSGENAAWESSLPTAPGSKLTEGYLKLTSGIATVRFESGAEVLLEAPSNLVLISPMRGKLVAGAAVVTVPKPAIGFVLETPDGYVVDHGTQFAVSVGSEGKSDFEVIEGEISVHLASTGEHTRLNEMESASMIDGDLTKFDGLLPENEFSDSPPTLRVGTNGRSGTVIKHNKRKKRIRPDLLMVKQGGAQGKWDLRSFFSFDVSGVDLKSVESARLRLNLVPSGFGYATRLPKQNRFAVYGLTNESKDDWIVESRWEDAPGPEDGALLGRFEIPRSQQRGSFGIDSSDLLAFVKANRDRPITLILVRETGQIAGEGPGLVHAFASDFHPKPQVPCSSFHSSDSNDDVSIW